MKLPENRKDWTIIGLLTLLAVTSTLLFLRQKIEPKLYIRVFHSVGAIPSSYWFDLQTAQQEMSFIGLQKDRIVLGSVGDLKKEFWAFVERDKVDETILCGVKVTNLLTDKIKSVLITDQSKYIYFVGSPENIAHEFINVLCQHKAL